MFLKLEILSGARKPSKLFFGGVAVALTMLVGVGRAELCT